MSKKNLKFTVKGNPAPGFSFAFCAGYGWNGTAVEVELDPTADVDPNLPLVICRKTLDELKADPRISVTIAGQDDEIEALRKRVAELEAENAELTAMINGDDAKAKKDAEGAAKAQAKAEAKAKKDAEGGK